jgi:hypothetical protein
LNSKVTGRKISRSEGSWHHDAHVGTAAPGCPAGQSPAAFACQWGYRFRSCLKQCGIRSWIKKKARLELPKEPGYLSKDGVYVSPYGNALTRRIATFLDQFLVSRFPYRFPKLRGLFSELRSFRHRIAPVCQRGESRPLQMGPLHRTDARSGAMVENTRKQSRIRGIERLRLEYPWAPCEDGYLFLLGWDAASESNDALGSLKTSGDNKNSSFLASQTSEARQFYATHRCAAPNLGPKSLKKITHSQGAFVPLKPDRPGALFRRNFDSLSTLHQSPKNSVNGSQQVSLPRQPQLLNAITNLYRQERARCRSKDSSDCICDSRHKPDRRAGIIL